MKGIILAGGSGSRLYPLTLLSSKQLQAIYDKPMIYYPLSLLMMCGIREIQIITTPKDCPAFQLLFGDGSHLGLRIFYKIQEKPAGLAQAYLLSESFLDSDDSIMILGDNLFHGSFQVFRDALQDQVDKKNIYRAQVFAYPVKDPQRYGVVEFHKATGEVISIEEKPQHPKSNFAIPGLYIFDSTVVAKAKTLKPSGRGELEITDLIQLYLNESKLKVSLINRGMAWLDTGTPQALLEASAYIGAIESRQGYKVACLEEIALRMEFITKEEFVACIHKLPKCDYREYLCIIAKEFDLDVT